MALSKNERLRLALRGGATVDPAKAKRAHAALAGGRGYSGAVGTTPSTADKGWTYIKKGGARALDALTVPQAALFTGVANATGNDVDWGAALGNFSRDEEGRSGQERALESLGISNKWAQLFVEVVADPLWLVGVAPISAAAKAAKAAQTIGDAAQTVDKVGDARKAAMIRAFSPKTQRPTKSTPRTKGDAQQSALVRAFATPSSARPRTPSEVQRAAGMRAFSPQSYAKVGDPTALAKALQGLRGVERAATSPAEAAALVPARVKVFLQSRNYSGGPRTATQVGDDVVVNIAKPGSRAKWAVVTKDALRQGEFGATLRAAESGRPVGTKGVFGSKAEALRRLDEFATRSPSKFSDAQKAALLRAMGAPKSGTKKAPMKYGPRRKSALVRALQAVEKGVPTQPAVRGALKEAVKSGKLTARQRKAFARMATAKPKLPKGAAVTAKAAKPLDKTKLAKALAGGKVVQARNAKGTYSIDQAGRPQNFEDAVAKLRNVLTEVETRPNGGKLGLKVGAGKFSKTVSTGIPLKAKKLAPKSQKPGFLRMKPIERVVHRLRDVGSESAGAVTANMIKLAEQYGMTTVDEAGNTVIKQSDASMIGVYRSVRSLNKDAGDRIEKVFRDLGWWEPRHSQLINDLDQRYKLLEVDIPGGMADHFMKPIKEAGEKRVALKQQLDDLITKRDLADLQGRGVKRYTDQIGKLNDDIAALDREIQFLKERGPYTPQGKNQAQIEAELERFRKDQRLGLIKPGSEYSARGDLNLLNEREVFDNPFMNLSYEEFLADMQAVGMKLDDAEHLARAIDSELDRIGQPLMGSKTSQAKPEWNAFLLSGRRENAHIWTQVERQIEQLIEESGIVKDGALAKSIQTGVRTDAQSRLGSTTFGYNTIRFITVLKGFMTFVNPAHFTTNFIGDFSNRQINGGFRHLSPLDAAPKNKFWELGSADVRPGQIDHKALSQVWDIPGQGQMTGAELLAMSRMVGLGRGYVGTDIAILVDAFEKAGRGPREWYRWAQRMNIKRENAQRLGTWVRHMQAGEDPITAMTKTLRVHFDYTQLTDFEKLVMRNVLLFYTWLKRNTVLQGGGLFTRPGLYSAYADLEEAREEIPNEPDYYKEAAAIPTPWGNFTVGAPWGDLRHYELSMDNFRKTILGSVTPLLRVPTEMALNAKAFTGGRIQDYEGEIVPSPFASLASALGVPVTETSVKEGGERVPGMDPWAAYILSQFTGPQLSTAQMATAPDQEGGILQQILGRVVGVRPQPDKPVQFKRSADYIKRKKKADETRRRNAQREAA